MNYNEAEVLRMMQSPDAKEAERGFRRLYDQYFERLYKTAYYQLYDRDLALELVQEMFLSIYQNKRRLSTVQNFERYYKKSVTNRVLRYIKGKARQESAEREFAMAATGLTEEINSQFDKRLELVRDMIENLPPQQKKVYLLAKLEGLSHEEISGRLGLAVSTTRHHVVRAKASLKKALKGLSAE